MSKRPQSNDEIRFLEIWDRIRKRIASDQCETHEFSSMLDILMYYWELVLENCKKNREIYDALCYVLREEIISKKERFTETSEHIDESAAVVDSGFETFHRESPTECSSKLSRINADQKITSYRRKCIIPRSKKILLRKLRNVTCDGAVVRNTFDIKVKNVKQNTNTYPYIVTAVMCCFACFIAFIPHRFFPWFFPLISFNSPPPL